MNVLQVNKLYHPHVGGIEEHVKVLSEGLKDSGVGVDVLCATEKHLGGIEQHNDVPVVKSSRIGTVKSVPISPTFPLHLQRLLSKSSIVHYHLPNPLAVLSSVLLPASGVPTVTTYHSDIVRQKQSLRVYKPILKRFLNEVNQIIVSSPRLVKNSKILKQYKDKCRVIPLSVNSDLVRDVDSTGPSADDDRTILFVGRLNYYKGIEYLIDAMQAVDGTLLIAGDGEKAEELQLHAERRGVAEKVNFLGYVPEEDLNRLYQAADVFVLPSVERSEAFGIVQLEAMANGVPVINTDLPTGVPWVSQDGETGLTVPPRDAAALAEALQELLNNPEKRAAFGANAKERVKEKFTTARMVEDTLSVYEQVAPESERHS